MAQQERAIRTRQVILQGAAEVFDEFGYDAASIKQILARVQVTKGALYFHFPSKEALARGVMQEQTLHLRLAQNASKLQQLVDVTMAVAHALPGDAMLRAGVRLALERGSVDFADSNPLIAWADVCQGLVEEAKAQGETLPQVDAKETAELVVGCFNGIQSFSQIVSGMADLERRISILWQHLLPCVATPSTLARLDTAPGRGARALLPPEEGGSELFQ
ncbi:ScbR family autoregulator-binding transcription factor [Kitasatospora sp. NPDC056138]|uniref:ScbR family autoregulator-binding transcription factor n=1 Tax=Kitasatospora sp. NPDC056138 TaxID=3345724 RepID=UPI0035D76BA2